MNGDRVEDPLNGRSVLLADGQRVVCHALHHLERVASLAAILVNRHGTLSIGVPEGEPSGRAGRLGALEVVHERHAHRVPDEPGGEVRDGTQGRSDHRRESTPILNKWSHCLHMKCGNAVAAAGRLDSLRLPPR